MKKNIITFGIILFIFCLSLFTTNVKAEYIVAALEKLPCLVDSSISIQTAAQTQVNAILPNLPELQTTTPTQTATAISHTIQKYKTIQSAINDTECNEISVVPGTYNEKLNITRSVKIEGQDKETTVIDGTGLVGPGITIENQEGVVISGLTVKNWENPIQDTIIVSGGGLYIVRSKIEITDLLINNNSAGFAGGLYIWGSDVTIKNSLITNNTIYGSEGGGIGVYASTQEDPTHLIIDNTILSYNEAISYGGGIHAVNMFDGDLVVEIINNSEISHNMSGMMGGGIYSQEGSLFVLDSKISDNVAEHRGGGVFIDEGDVSFERSLIEKNTAFLGGGGIYVSGNTSSSQITRINDSTFSENESSGYSGGLYINSANAEISNSVFSFNVSQRHAGGIFIYNGLQSSNSYQFEVLLHNVTVVQNMANENGSGISIIQEAFANNPLTVRLNNCSVLENNLTSGLEIEGDAAVYVSNSIIANNANNCTFVDGGVLRSQGSNLSNDQTCNFTHAKDLIETDVKLGFLQDNGGPTKTMLPQIGSPAINNGNNANCETTDQRGYSRGSDCDIGAVERQPRDSFAKESLQNNLHLNNPATMHQYLRK